MTEKQKLSIKASDDGKFQVVDERGEVLDTYDHAGDAEAAKEKYLALASGFGDDDPDAEAEAKEAEGEATTEPVSEHNPFGLNIHQRFAQLLRTLDRRGIKHSETDHPGQNANTAATNFARKPKDGQNALPQEDKLKNREPDPAPPATTPTTAS